MLTLHIGKTRNGALFVTAETTSPAPPYTLPQVTREEWRFDVGESVSEVFAKVGERVANMLERQT